MKKYSTLFLLSIIATLPLYGQTDQKPQEVVIKFEQTQAQPQLPSIEKMPIEKANEWVDFGKNVGTAMAGGLSALTDEANKFSGTPAGRFTMAVIAWKVAGDDAMELIRSISGILIGVPILTIWICLYIWIMRKFFIKHQVCVEKKGFWLWAEKKYQTVNDGSLSGDECGMAFIASLLFIAVGAILLGTVIF